MAYACDDAYGICDSDNFNWPRSFKPAFSIA